MRFLVLFILMLVLTISGCADDPVIKECHDRVHMSAKNSAKIITTEEINSRKTGKLMRIEGRAQLQNGFGAWSNYQYFCGVYGKSIVSFSMSEGWR